MVLKGGDRRPDRTAPPRTGDVTFAPNWLERQKVDGNHLPMTIDQAVASVPGRRMAVQPARQLLLAMALG